MLTLVLYLVALVMGVHRVQSHGDESHEEWIGLKKFTDSSCSTSATGFEADAIDVCIPDDGESYKLVLVTSNNKFSLNRTTYTASSTCTGVSENEVYAVNQPLSTCIFLSTLVPIFGNYYYIFSISSSTPSLPYNGPAEKRYVDSACSEKYLYREEVTNANTCYIYDIQGTVFYAKTTCDGFNIYTDDKCSKLYIAPTNSPVAKPTKSPSTTKTPSYAPIQSCSSNGDGTYSIEYCQKADSAKTSCFAGSETLLLQSGEVKLISEIIVGDKVFVSSMDGLNTEYSSVVAVPHLKNQDVATFTHIFTESGDVKLTNDHLIVGGSCDADVLPLKPANELVRGECVQTVQGKEIITSVQSTNGEGVYTVVTLSSDKLLVVNGVIASSFASNHALGNAYYSIHRFIYGMFPSVSSYALFANVAARFGNIVTNVFAM